jgi:hypothetical protein
MALMKAATELRVVDGSNVFTVGTEPTEVPEFLVEAALAAGATKADDKPVKKTATKAVE